MDAQSLDTHKKVLGIIYVILASLSILGALFIRIILSLVFGFAFEGANDEEQRIGEFVMAITSILPVFMIIFIGLPTLLAGIGLLARKQWGVIFGLIIGCLNLIWIPIGTAIGVYAIWIYSEDQKFKRAVSVQ